MTVSAPETVTVPRGKSARLRRSSRATVRGSSSPARRAAAARRAGEDEPHTVARELRRSRAHFPRGTVTVAETVAQRLYLAEATAGGFAVTPS